MLPLRRRRSTAVWLLTGQVARMPPLVGEGYGNRRDRPLVDFDGAKVAHAIKAQGRGTSVQRPPLGPRSVGIGWVAIAILTFIIF
jgi:hypothetical protein